MYKMGSLRTLLTVALLLLPALCKPVTSEPEQDVQILNKVHASIMNRLGSDKSLGVHCRSADDDLGAQTVAEGSDYGFNFTVNVSGSTLFYCDLQWDGVDDFHFDVFNYHRDWSRCASQCLWLASQEGVYSFNGGTGIWEYMYQWSS